MAERYRIKLNDEDIDLSSLEKLDNYDLENLFIKTKNKNIMENIYNIFKERDELGWMSVAFWRRNNTPEYLIRKLYKDSNNKDSMYLARCKNCPEDLLEKFSNSSDKNVRYAVAENKNTPEDVLRSLAEDGDRMIRRAVEENPNCTIEIKEIVENSFKHKKSKGTLTERVVIEKGSYGLPVNVHLIGDVKEAYNTLKNSHYGFGNPNGAYTDVYIQEAINPQDEDIDCYVGYYPEDVGYSDDDLVQRYIDKGQDDKAVARIKRLAKQNGEEIYWCAGTWDDPWSEALGGYEIDSPEAFEK